MVERLHRSLKASLMATTSTPHWANQLPWVLLGLRTNPKDDGPSAAERVYGEPLTLPSDFFPSTSDISPKCIYDRVKQFIPCKRSYTPKRHIYIPSDLKKCSHIFLRVDSHRPPLSPPYKGPYEKVQTNEKLCQIRIHGKLQWVSIDRVKPAYINSSYP